MDPCNISQLRPLLEENGFRFSKSMGQNFLIASWVPEDIAAAAVQQPGTSVLEIGPGAGCLTRCLSDRAEKVVSVELDRRLLPVLKVTLEGRENVEIINSDALKLDLAALAEEKLRSAHTVACANLPYNITTPAITALLEAGCFETVTVMIQKEVAQRICAAPGSADYGAFTVFVAARAKAEMLFDVPAGCFVPQPKVTSCVVRMTRLPAPPPEIHDMELFSRVVRASFAQRRKTLANGLSGAFGSLSKQDIAAAIENAGLSPTVRGETLGIPEFAAVCDELKKLL